jgi:hypothetical protein
MGGQGRQISLSLKLAEVSGQPGLHNRKTNKQTKNKQDLLS